MIKLKKSILLKIELLEPMSNVNVKEKILLLFTTGLNLGFTYSLHRQWKIIKSAAREWKKINEKSLSNEIRKLYRSKLVQQKENSDGSFTFILTEKGRLKTLTYHFQNLRAKREIWDRKWRIVVFDIPEKMKRARNALREKLKEIGFYELQKSVFIFPFKCEGEVEFVIEFFNLRKYVRVGTLESIDNELHLKKIFKLI